MEQGDVIVAASQSSGDSPAATKQSPEAKRQGKRVALACQRCKHRKQKCDGAEPSCSTCKRFKVQCRYIVSSTYKPKTAKIYISALEEHIAKLEMSLANQSSTQIAPGYWSDTTAGDEIDPLLRVVRDLSLNTGGYYVGSTSSITLARILASVVGPRDESEFDPQSQVAGFNAETSHHVDPFPEDTGTSLMIDDEIADKLVQTFIKCISPRLPVLHPAHIQNLYVRRSELVEPYHKAILHLVFALAGAFLAEAMGDNTEYCIEDHLQAALIYRDAVLGLGDARTVIYLLLLTQHYLRVPKKMGAWTLVGLAMRLCVELGLHRRRRQKVHSLRSEIEKRLFWSCYYLDRELSVSLGRPSSIADHDIDVELPLDVDDGAQDAEVLTLAAEQDQSKPRNPPTTLTYFIHLIRLKRIQSEIQTTIYRVDSVPSAAESERATDAFLKRLAAWKEAIPPRDSIWDAAAKEKATYNEDVYIISYHRCIRLLLQPQLHAPVINERYFDLCLESSRGVCEGYKRLYHHMPMSFSSLSLQTVFIAGLTIVYCLWYTNSTAAALRNFNALNDCSIMLYVMTERWNSTSKYRDVFEIIKRTVVERISEGDGQARQTVGGVMSADVRSTLQGLNLGMAESNRNALEQMIQGMTGEELQFDEQRVGLDIDMLGGDAGDGVDSCEDLFTSNYCMEQAPVDFDLSV